MSVAFSGAGKLWIAGRVLRRWVAVSTGKNPTDRAKLGSKIHILVDQRGAPLAIDISGANQHDKWSVKNLVFHIAVQRPGAEQHFCSDKGYDYDDVRQVVEQAGYIAHIKRKRKRGEPAPDPCPAPGEPNSQHGAGWSNALWAGWRSGVVCGPVGARNPPTG